MNDPSPQPPPPNLGLVAPPAGPRGTSRRWFLAGGLAVLAGGGAGVGAEFLRERPGRRTPPAGPPAVLVDAVAAERRLIADLDATTGGDPAVRAIIRQARADHVAHLAALRGVVATYGRGAPSGSVSPSGTSTGPGRPQTGSQLRAAEQRASAAAAARAARLAGGQATLLASIAACEATHAELLG
jgi:hypothetical protein